MAFSFLADDFQIRDSATMIYQWKLTGMKELIENSKEDERSQTVTSPTFGEDRWQMQFYPSLGRDASCSLFLAALPTAEELRVGALSNLSKVGQDLEEPPWSRRGPFAFSFEVKALDGSTIVDRTSDQPMTKKKFNNGLSTWGYPAYVGRGVLYENNLTVKADDAIKIICTISYPIPKAASLNPEAESMVAPAEDSADPSAVLNSKLCPTCGAQLSAPLPLASAGD